MLPLLVANFKIMVRDRQTIFWALVFPLIFVVVFGLFDVGGPSSVDLGIVDHANTALSQSISGELAEIEFLDIHTGYASETAAREHLSHGHLEFLLVIPDSLGQIGSEGSSTVPVRLYYDQFNVQDNQLVVGVVRHFFDDVNLRLTGVERLVEVAPQPVRVAGEVEYFDVLLIGLVGMGVMFNSVIVIGVRITQYRQQSILKRILVTPLPVRRFFASEVLAQLALSLVQAAIILGVGVFVFGASLHGNIGWLFLIIAFANITFINIGFAISGLANNPAAASGMGNVVAVPMMFFSGTFFSISTLPSFLPDLVQVLPLTPTLDAMREVALYGSQPWNVWRELSMLAGWLVASSAVAVKLFRFG